MDDELLIRLYNVGLGDCIYIRVPDANKHRHILIDCGNTDGDKKLLGRAIDEIAKELQNDRTKNHALDLLVVTHPHSDHIAGFGVHTEKFKRLEIRNIWLSASMNPDHEQAEGAKKLQAFADETLEEFSRLPLGPALDEVIRELFSLSNKPALEALRVGLPKQNKLREGKPKYVHDRSRLPSLFQDKTTKLSVLAPRKDIDGEYLGRMGQALARYSGERAAFAPPREGTFSENWLASANTPANVSSRDFRRLRERLFKNALSFVLSNNELVNNTSVVLLLEWGKQRFLFTGDAQFKASRDGEYEWGKPNGSWNVMWHYHKVKLSKPIDFLKVGHHGSENATPWVKPEAGKPAHPINVIFDSLVPPQGRKTEVVISTERMKYPTIPDRKLVTELGKRAKKSFKYDELKHLKGRMEGGKWSRYKPTEELLVPSNVPQPARTDLEHQRTGDVVICVDRRFKRLP